eukprot:6132464-Amphidinium_carterae.1
MRESRAMPFGIHFNPIQHNIQSYIEYSINVVFSTIPKSIAFNMVLVQSRSREKNTAVVSWRYLAGFSKRSKAIVSSANFRPR